MKLNFLRSPNPKKIPVFSIESFRMEFLSGHKFISKDVSLFYDQAQTHTFSDWLVPYSFGVGVEDLEEYYFGGLPDLSEFLERTAEGFTLDQKSFDRISKSKLLQLGRKLKKQLPGKIFLDLGCGNPDRSIIPRVLAQKFGSAAYIGVDSFHLKDHERRNEFPGWSDFVSIFFQADVLEFLSELRDPGPKVFFFAGLEFDSEKKDSLEIKKYREALSSELSRLCRSGDLVFFGAGSPDLGVPEDKFRRTYRDLYQEIYERA